MEYGGESILIEKIETLVDGTGWKNVDEVKTLYTQVFGTPKVTA